MAYDPILKTGLQSCFDQSAQTLLLGLNLRIVCFVK